jgi:hypothetical protein
VSPTERQIVYLSMGKAFLFPCRRSSNQIAFDPHFSQGAKQATYLSL